MATTVSERKNLGIETKPLTIGAMHDVLDEVWHKYNETDDVDEFQVTAVAHPDDEDGFIVKGIFIDRDAKQLRIVL